MSPVESDPHGGGDKPVQESIEGVVARRTFDTPHFRGIEFIEVEAKSILNSVPGNYLPFNWTINPYRGCTHACTYCMAGDTPILMADGSTKPLEEIEAGDAIYGTEQRGAYRRYVTTRVLAHWATVESAFRITLEDGTQLVASGDHRFLTERGWKHVTGAEQGTLRRPHLTLNNRLVGTGQFATGPQQDADYRRGYLCGLIRGDGHLGSYSYSRPGRRVADVHRFRLALVDFEALLRAREYLLDGGVETREFVFQHAVGASKALSALRTSSFRGVTAIREIIQWPESVSEEWCKGFLAGIFDAEGSSGGGIFRIANTDPEIIDRVTACMARFGFSYKVESSDRPRPLYYVRLLGGLPQRLRFWHTVEPAISRKRSIAGRAVKNAGRLRVVSIEPVGERRLFDITTGTGDFIANGVISHNCFARVTHTYMDMDAGRDFESKIVVKVNAPQLLRRELRARRWKGEPVAMGTATDPYQRAEGRYRLMPRIIEALTEVRNPFSILTKGTLILRDLELLAAAAEVMDVSTAFSIGTLDEEVWERSEPGTPHPKRRMEAVARLNAAGVACGVMVAPILPGLSDSEAQLRAVVEAALEAGATHVTPILLHLRPRVREVYMSWLARDYPHLVSGYEELYQSAYAPKADQNQAAARVRSLVSSAGGVRNHKPSRNRARSSEERKEDAGPTPAAEQLRLI